jgi:hypothetical protein
MPELYFGAIKLDAVVFFLGERRTRPRLRPRLRSKYLELWISFLLDVFFPFFVFIMHPYVPNN